MLLAGAKFLMSTPLTLLLVAVFSVLFPFILALNDDVLSLIVFKSNLLDPHSNLRSWNEDDDSACNWAFVECDSITNRVSNLTLDALSLSGRLGKTLIGLQHLKLLQLSRNNFSGAINPILAKIPSLELVDFTGNAFSGPIPDALFQQCGSLKLISVAENSLTGSIPLSLSSCSNLETLNFSSNRLSGQLPSGFWNLSLLRSLDLSGNLLQGRIPEGIGRLYDLELLNLSGNSFEGLIPQDIRNCLKLKYIDFGRNLLTGEFPDWVGEMRGLEFLYLSGNSFSGRIPTTVGNLQFIKEVNLSNNQFRGNLPESLGNCYNLKVLDASKNLLSGNLPLWVFQLALETLSLSDNRYSGSFGLTPGSYLQSYQTLEVLDLSSNTLTGGIPWAIGNFSRLQSLNLSRNYLVGHIPSSVVQLNTISVLDLSHNQLSGSIPQDIGNCSSLTSLVMSRNNLTGPFPISISILSNLEFLDMSFNNLSGSLPKELINLSHLIMFNVSFNDLDGELPEGGFFDMISPSSVFGNPLCGSIVNLSCPAIHAKPLVLNPNSSSSNHSPLSPNLLSHKRIVLSISSLVAIGAAVFIALGVLTISILNMHARTSMTRATTATAAPFAFSNYSPSHESEANCGKLVMFTGDVDFVPGSQGLLNKDSELGRGGFGSVYMAEAQNKRTLAIKKLNTTSLVKCKEDFEREIKKLCKIGHDNLVLLEGYYWTPSLQLLINEYVSRGSLYKHLHESGICLTWQERFKIIIGTAKGLAHLHRMNIIHYNMKSSNVLIDSSGESKVGDFGLAGLLPAFKSQSGLGYMAPEFACQSVRITEKCDVYGFGILCLEVITGRRPVEYLEDDVVVVCDRVRGALVEGRMEEYIDEKLKGVYPMEEVMPVVKLGLICASQVPSNRPDMEEVTRILEMIRCPMAMESHQELEGFSR